MLELFGIGKNLSLSNKAERGVLLLLLCASAGGPLPALGLGRRADDRTAAWRGERGRPRGWGPVRMDSVRVVGLMNGRAAPPGGAPAGVRLGTWSWIRVLCWYGICK